MSGIAEALDPSRAQQGSRAGVTPVWTPQHRPGCDQGEACACPQVLAFNCTADILGYGGEGGGGKTDLLLGLAGRNHQQSIIFRREFPRVRAIIERSRQVFNARGDTHARDSYNEQTHLWRLRDGRMIEFAAIQYEQDKFNYQGRPHDFYGFDEATEFSESQVRFVIGWNRSTHTDPATGKPQRCRVVMTFNPPMNEAGEWVVKFFQPWLAYLHPKVYSHPRPARPGELRWYATVAGEDTEIPESDLGWYVETDTSFRAVDSGEPYRDATGAWIVPVRGIVRDGALLMAKSRTFIPASLKDNPILQRTGYSATIDAMEEPYRSLMRGIWGANVAVDPWQLIPPDWVVMANARHKARVKPDVPMQSAGADIARGGRDRMSIVELYGNWIPPIKIYPGGKIPDGPTAAALLLPYLLAGVPIGLDIISIGSSVYDSLVSASEERLHRWIRGINFGAGCPTLRDKSKTFKFKNIRAAGYWKLREALDPTNGDDFALPDDPELKEELCAPRFEVTASGIQIEDKNSIKSRIGRSPDKADALVLALYNLLTKPPPTVVPLGDTRRAPWSM